MSVYISQSFIDTWSAEAKLQFQQTESLLRDTCRVVTGVIGRTHKFPIVGPGVATVNKARHADLQPMNLSSGIATATLSDVHAPELIDDLDELKTNMDIRAAYTKSVTAAASRQLDQLILTALAATANDATSSLVTANTLDAPGLTEISTLLTLNFVPKDQERQAVIGPGGMKSILNSPILVNDLYTTKGAIDRGFAKNVLGFSLTESVLLPGVATTGNHTAYFFHKQAIGLAMAADISLAVNYLPLKDSWLLVAKLSAGAVIIDPLGVYKATIAN